MAEIYARKFLNTYETLNEHMETILSVGDSDQKKVKELIKAIKLLDEDRSMVEWLILQLTKYTLVYHDIGKKTNGFQNRVLGYRDSSSPHSMHSAFYYIGDMASKLEEHQKTIHYYKWVYLIGYIISAHHNNNINARYLHSFESRLLQYIKDGKYSDFMDSDISRLLEPALLTIGKWQEFDTNNDITIQAYDVVQMALNYLIYCDHEAARRYEETQINQLITEDEFSQVAQLKLYLDMTAKFAPVEFKYEDTLLNYSKKLISERLQRDGVL